MPTFTDSNPHEKLEQLFNALMALMSEGNRSLDDISISEIIATSGVSRNYYYRHFSSKEALIGTYLDYRLARLTRELQHQKDATSRDLLTFYFNRLQTSSTMMTQLVNSGRRDILNDAMWRSLHFLMAHHQITPKDNDAYWFDFAAAGIASVAISWLMDQTPIPAEVMATKTLAFLAGQ